MIMSNRPLFSLDQLTLASETVYAQMAPTPQYAWPQLCEAMGTEFWLKHENHTATGAFKIRGGITFMEWLRTQHPETQGLITATRGNHGQSQARAARAAGIHAKILVPEGNCVEKNAAMRAFGAELVEFGRDFDAAKAEAARLAQLEGRTMAPPFHEQLILGVASYALELFSSVNDLDVVYVPVGCGSGICGVIAARDALGLKTEVVGVVSSHADAAKQSFELGRIVETDSANTFADGMAVRRPVEEAFEIYSTGASRMVAVNDDQVADAVRLIFSSTHNVAEGAGAAALAAALHDREKLKGKKVAAILSGGNIDTPLFSRLLRGKQ